MLKVNIDASELQGFAELDKSIQAAAQGVGANLTQMMRAKAVELAGARLHSRRMLYVQNLFEPYQEDGVWVMGLKGEAAFIEEGQHPHSMLDALLSGPNVQPAKDGSRYVVVPFKHGPGMGPASTGPAQMDLVQAVQAKMKSDNIPWKTLERDDQGRPKVGLLHKFNVDHVPTKSHVGPQQGWGPVGDVRQGPNARQVAGGGPGGGGTPFLHGVSVYQNLDQKTGKPVRSVMTFRIASSKHYGTDRWRHPGIAGVNILLEVHAWALQTLERDVLPDLVAKLGASF